MSRRALAAVAALAMAMAAPARRPVLSASSAPPESAPTKAVPRTSDGRPDLQGYWTNDSYTPLERPAELGTKALFSEEEAAAHLKRHVDLLHGQAKDNIHYDDAIWQGENYDKLAHLRTSLIVDPPDGRVPPLTPEGAAREAVRVVASRRRGPADSAEYRSLAERCISWGNVGPPMVPPTYNANFQVVQTPALVVIRHEMMHDVRMVAMDGSPHLGADLRQLAGDSRGRWEGDTLVVETTNFTDETNFRGAPARTRQDILASAALRVVERFTPIDADTIRYEFTVEDPGTWIRPWSGEMPIRRFGGPIYEFACHEGNYGLSNILSAARVLGQ